jgi:squalene-hopene/tetraprenyl-beta-curcumene cyclase
MAAEHKTSSKQRRICDMRVITSLVAGFGLGAIVLATAAAGADDPPVWNARGAAGYLDGQMTWWASWPNAQRDRGTFCVSCHTVAPYAMARPALATVLGEAAPPEAAQRLYDNVAMRVRLWNEVAPFYPDQTRGIPKTSESRGTESVLNALVLATRDAQAGTLSDETRTAFGHMWALQMKTGPLDGAWAWLNFHYEPWEAEGSPYFGAAMAVAALGAAPGGYASSADAKAGFERLRTYVTAKFDGQNVFNRSTMIAASAHLDGLVTAAQRSAAATEVARLQASDGGWSLSGFGEYVRGDKTALDTAPDGYATALAVLVLRRAHDPALQPALTRGLAWLGAHQDDTGRWRSTSLNKQRDPASDPARFMNDAATAYAVLALSAR